MMKWKRNNIAVVLAVLTASLFSSCEKNEDLLILDDGEEEIVTRKPKLYDIDGNEYTIDLVAGRQWMVENLKTSRYRNGELIPNVTDPTEWSILESGAYAWYDNDPSNDEKLGKLYNWHAVACCQICPEGWRIPTKEEFEVLLSQYRVQFWNVVKGEQGTEWTNFNSIGAERRNSKGEFKKVLDYPNSPKYLFTGFWSSTVYNQKESFIVYVYAPPSNLIRAKLELSIQPKQTGISVKCIKDL